jgi:hypothetical protein
MHRSYCVHLFLSLPLPDENGFSIWWKPLNKYIIKMSFFTFQRVYLLKIQHKLKTRVWVQNCPQAHPPIKIYISLYSNYSCP